MTASPKNEKIVARPAVRENAAAYAAFIAKVVGEKYPEIVASEFFAEIVELTFESPKEGLGISAFRASEEYRAAKDAKESAKLAAEAEARRERLVRDRAKFVEKVGKTVASAVRNGLFDAAEAEARKLAAIEKYDAEISASDSE